MTTALKRRPLTLTDGNALLEGVYAALLEFAEHPERRTLIEREGRLRGELAGIERALAAALHPPPAESSAVALAEGRAPASDAREGWQFERTALQERRRLLGQALEVLTRRRAETDVRVARTVLTPLLEPYRRAAAEQAQRVRELAEANDLLAQVSGALERAGCLGASGVLFPMIFQGAGGWADRSSPARHFWREAIEHGFVRDAD